MSSYQYRDPHVKDKTVSPTVLSLTWESPYLGKTVFILRRGPDACISYTGNDMIGDEMVTQDAMISATVVSKYVSGNIPVSAS